MWLAVAVSGFAQEGHPLAGTWFGDWGPTATERHRVTLVLQWDGNAVTGLINPGPDSTQIGSVLVDVTNWTVRIDADAVDVAGHPVHIAVEGRLEDIGSPHRSMAGTWRQGSVTANFKLTRD